MANEAHLAILEQGVDVWNEWRRNDPNVWSNLSRTKLGAVDLSGADLHWTDLNRTDLSEANLTRADLNEANLTGANLSEADLSEADLSGADLRQTDLRATRIKDTTRIDAKWHLVWEIVNRGAKGRAFRQADLSGADLSGADFSLADLSLADLREANLSGTKFTEADLSGAKLMGADLSETTFVKTNLTEANLTNCRIYGISAWDLNLTDTIQKDLIVTPDDQSAITVDDLEVAQFIYLLLHNEKIRDVINTITSKTILILGRFTPDRKAVLDAIRNKLRDYGFTPILFDFGKPTDRDFTETIMTLAGMCRFIIADITNPKSAPLELQATVPNYMIPFVPIIQEGEHSFAMFQDIQGKFDWVLDTLTYQSQENLIAGLEQAVILPALEKHEELVLRKMAKPKLRRVEDYLR